VRGRNKGIKGSENRIIRWKVCGDNGRFCCIRGASGGLQSNRESKLAAQGTEEVINVLKMA
jgi:hypothetical protein